MPTTRDAVVYSVNRLTWRTTLGGGAEWLRLPGELPIELFPTLLAAQTNRRDREQAARARVLNPFACGIGWHDHTSFPPDIFADWLRDENIGPPRDLTTLSSWQRWWTDEHARFTELERDHIWNGLTELSFYKVRTHPRAGGVVVQLTRGPLTNSSSFRGCEGGANLVAYSQYDAAREHVARTEQARGFTPLSPEQLADLTPTSPLNYNLVQWALRWMYEPNNTAVDPDETIQTQLESEAPSVWAYPVPLIAAADGVQWSAVVRYGVDYLFAAGDTLYARASFFQENQSSGRRLMPVSLHDSRTAALAHAEELNREARTLADPFRICRHADGSVHWEELSARPTGELVAELVRQRVELPADEFQHLPRRVWVNWWDAQVRTLPPERRSLIWELFTEVQFFGVQSIDRMG